MSTKIAELRGQHDAKSSEAKRLLDECPRNARMPKATSDRIDSLLFEIEAIDREISRTLQVTEGEFHGSVSADSPDVCTTPDGERIQVLRTSGDIRAHYAGRAGSNGQSQGEKFGLADFVRGIAGLKTVPGVQNALSVGTDSQGGFSVPSLIMPGIMEALVPNSALLSAGTGIIPLLDGGKTFSTAGINAIPTAAWRAEAGSITESDPTFRSITATPRSLAFLFKVSRELLADSPFMDQALRLAIAQSFARELDRAGLIGTGTPPEPRGVLNISGIQSIANGTNGAALTGFANFFSAVQAILAADGPMPTAAIMNPRSLVKLGGLLDTTGQPIAVPPMLQPIKLLSTSQIPVGLTVGTSVDCSQIFVGDFTRCAFVMRENISIQLADQLYAATGQLAFICHMRVDFVCWYPATLAAITGIRP